MLPKYKNLRLKFPKGKQKKFIENILTKNGVTIFDISKTVNVSPRTLRDWKREKFSITHKAVMMLCKKFAITPTFNVNTLVKRWTINKQNICRKVGIAQYKKYGNFSTPEGCKKGGSKTLSILRQKGIIADYKHFKAPQKKSADLAEFIGIMLGDGGLTKYQATVTLNTEADREYIRFVKQLIVKLFHDKPTVYNRKDCRATTITVSGIKIVEYLTKLGLVIGDKVKHQVGVPSWINNSNTFNVACLRGLMDTDGCVCKVIHVIKSKRYIYYNPCFKNASIPILKFVKDTLISLGLHPSMTGRHVWLYNSQEVKRYFDLVGSNNTRLLNKFQEGIPNGSGESLLNFDV